MQETLWFGILEHTCADWELTKVAQGLSQKWSQQASWGHNDKGNCA